MQAERLRGFAQTYLHRIVFDIADESIEVPDVANQVVEGLTFP